MFASTIVLSGQLWLKVEKAGQETVAAQIGQILNQTADFRASVRSRGRKVADDYAIPTLFWLFEVLWGVTSIQLLAILCFGSYLVL